MPRSWIHFRDADLRPEAEGVLFTKDRVSFAKQPVAIVHKLGGERFGSPCLHCVVESEESPGGARHVAALAPAFPCRGWLSRNSVVPSNRRKRTKPQRKLADLDLVKGQVVKDRSGWLCSTVCPSGGKGWKVEENGGATACGFGPLEAGIRGPCWGRDGSFPIHGIARGGMPAQSKGWGNQRR